MLMIFTAVTLYALPSETTGMKDLECSLLFSGELAQCTGSAGIVEREDRVTVITELLRKDRDSWHVVCSWVGHSYGATIAIAEGACAVQPGKAYKVRVTAMAYDDERVQLNQVTQETEERFLERRGTTDLFASVEYNNYGGEVCDCGGYFEQYGKVMKSVGFDRDNAGKQQNYLVYRFVCNRCARTYIQHAPDAWEPA